MSVSISPTGRVRSGLVWDGLDDLVRFLERTLPREVDMVIEIAGRKTAEEAKEKAKSLVTVDTGSLRKSIRIDRRRKEGKTSFIGIGAGGFIRNPRTGRLVDYASYVEFGTSRMRPQPFMRPALRWAQNNRLKKNIWEAMAKIPG